MKVRIAQHAKMKSFAGGGEQRTSGILLYLSYIWGGDSKCVRINQVKYVDIL